MRNNIILPERYQSRLNRRMCCSLLSSLVVGSVSSPMSVSMTVVATLLSSSSVCCNGFLFDCLVFVFVVAVGVVDDGNDSVCRFVCCCCWKVRLLLSTSVAKLLRIFARRPPSVVVVVVVVETRRL